jgi:hypothetical protein
MNDAASLARNDGRQEKRSSHRWIAAADTERQQDRSASGEKSAHDEGVELETRNRTARSLATVSRETNQQTMQRLAETCHFDAISYPQPR